MPVLDGQETLRRLRAEAECQTPVIMLSAKGQEQDVRAALSEGARDYIIKPFDPQELLARILQHIKPR